MVISVTRNEMYNVISLCETLMDNILQCSTRITELFFILFTLEIGSGTMHI